MTQKQLMWGMVALIAAWILVFAVLAHAQTANLAINWDPPTQNDDGTPLTDLHEYMFCVSLNLSIPDSTTLADWATVCTATVKASATDTAAVALVEITSPRAGTLYVRGVAIDTSGNASVLSNEASADFDYLPPAGFTVRIRKL